MQAQHALTQRFTEEFSICPFLEQHTDATLKKLKVRKQDTSHQPVDVLVDLCVHQVKANGQTRPKVFKLKTLSLPAGGSALLRKVLSLQEMSTRKHYPGVHTVTLLVNGNAQALGAFELLQG